MTLIHWSWDFYDFHFLPWIQSLRAWMPFNPNCLAVDHQLGLPISNSWMITFTLLMEEMMTFATLGIKLAWWSCHSCSVSGFWWCWPYISLAVSCNRDRKMSIWMASHSEWLRVFCCFLHLLSWHSSCSSACVMSFAVTHFQPYVSPQPDPFLSRSPGAAAESSHFVFWFVIIKL